MPPLKLGGLVPVFVLAGIVLSRTISQDPGPDTEVFDCHQRIYGK